MTRVLLTGGSGFLAGHVLETLLQRGHSVVTSVRSQEKADFLKKAYAKYNNLDTVIVEDVARADGMPETDVHAPSNKPAFDKAIVSDHPFEAVIHTASPFTFKVEDNKRDILDPAINGTTGILNAIHKYAPTVKRVVITSSFAAMWDQDRKEWHAYTEEDWNPQTMEDALKDKTGGYRGSKKLAERAAWDFMEKTPGFSLATCCPPLMLGPVVQYLNSLDAINTSNQIFRDLVTGACKEKLIPTGLALWVDVRDAALAHVLAMEKQEAGGQRFFVVAGEFSNKKLAELAAQQFPQLKSKLPADEALESGALPASGSLTGFDNARSKEVLGLTYGPLDTCVKDTIQSILDRMQSLLGSMGKGDRLKRSTTLINYTLHSMIPNETQTLMPPKRLILDKPGRAGKAASVPDSRFSNSVGLLEFSYSRKLDIVFTNRDVAGRDLSMSYPRMRIAL